MRLWTLHPQHLDPVGLVALWREALLAQAVLHARTRGYRHHPQLDRFRAAADPPAAIHTYLHHLVSEARRRGYRFNGSLIGGPETEACLLATDGQIAYEWEHLGQKLRRRNPTWYGFAHEGVLPGAHPLFRVVAGPVAVWERPASSAAGL